MITYSGSKKWALVSLSILLSIIFLALSGCTVKFVSQYDEITDSSVTALQRKVETFMVTLESQDGLPECSYEHHKEFYQEAKVDLSAMRVRAAAISKNKITVAQLKLLSDSFIQLENLHKLKVEKSESTNNLRCITKDEVSLLRTAFNSSFTAILKLELAKKRGE
ncbi:MAG TPA: hypothetical protein ENG89_00100 [Candidatus Moranbacteria bacterium]|nr:hypothetical protein [Candidatus Moranbacteria bacterium]